MTAKNVIVCKRDENGYCTTCGWCGSDCIIENALVYMRDQVLDCPHCKASITQVLENFEAQKEYIQ